MAKKCTLLAKNDTIPAGYKKCALIMPLFMSAKLIRIVKNELA
jgi:hypothetical protein